MSTIYKLAETREMVRPEINVTSYPDNFESDRHGDYNSNAIIKTILGETSYTDLRLRPTRVHPVKEVRKYNNHLKLSLFFCAQMSTLSLFQHGSTEYKIIQR